MRPRDVALALLVVLLWGVNYAVIKIGLRGVSPFVLGALRMIFTAFPAIFFVRRPRLPFRVFAGFALGTFFGQFSLLFLAIKIGMPSGLASVVQQSQLFFTILLAAVVFHEHPRAAQIAGMVLAAIGLGIIGAQSGATFPFTAFALTVGCAASWAAGNIVSRSLSRFGPVNGLAFVVWAALIPPLPFLALSLLAEGPEAIPASFRAMDAGSWAAVGYLAFGATLGGFGLWNKLLKAYPAAQVARFALLVPVVGIFCGTVLLGERLGAAQLVGSALVVLAVALPVAAVWLERRV